MLRHPCYSTDSHGTSRDSTRGWGWGNPGQLFLAAASCQPGMISLQLVACRASKEGHFTGRMRSCAPAVDSCGPMYILLGNAGTMDGMSNTVIDQDPQPYCDDPSAYTTPWYQPTPSGKVRQLALRGVRTVPFSNWVTNGGSDEVFLRMHMYAGWRIIPGMRRL